MKKYFSLLLTVLVFASFVFLSCDSGGSGETPKTDPTKNTESLEGGVYTIDQFNTLLELNNEVTIKGNSTVWGQGAISITGKTLVLDANLMLSKSFPPPASPEFVSELPLPLAEPEGEPDPDIIFVVLDGNIVKSDGAKIKAVNGTKCYVAGVSKVDSNIFDSTSIPASYRIPASDDITQGGIITDWTLSSTGPAAGKTLFVSGILTIDNNSAMPSGTVRSLGKVSITGNTGSLLKSEKLILDNAASISLSGSGNVDLGTRSINYLEVGSASPKLSGGSVTIVKGLTSPVSFTVGSEAALTLGTASSTTLNGNVTVNGTMNILSGAKGEGAGTVTVKPGAIFNNLSIPIGGSDPWAKSKIAWKFEHESTVSSKLFVTSLDGIFTGSGSLPNETYDTINFTMLNSTGDNEVLIQTTEGASLTLSPDNYHLIGNASVKKMFALSGGDTLTIEGGTLALAGTKSLYALSGKIIGSGTGSTLDLSAGSSSIIVMPNGSDLSGGNPTFNFYDKGGTLLTRDTGGTTEITGIYKWIDIGGGTVGWKAQE